MSTPTTAPTPSACKYCGAAEPGAPAGLRELGSLPASRVYMLFDQRHPGRCVVASRVHARELFELDAAQRHAFIDEVGAVAEVLQQTLGADKMNVGFYGDIVDHLHAHVVPKFNGGADWGAPFALQCDAGDAASRTRLDTVFDALRQALAAVATRLP